MYTGVVITVGRCAQLMAGSGDCCRGNSLTKMVKMRQWIIQKGAFLQTPLLLVKAIKGKKIEPLKMKAAIMYLFSIICVEYNCMHIY